MNLVKFLQTIIGDAEETCFSRECMNTNVAMLPYDTDLFFSINNMHTSRKDANVIHLRNFLIEIDSLPLEEQVDYVLERVPVTSIVYSGGKSYHFIISLETPVPTIEKYREIAERLLLLLPAADPTSKNPSRFSRLPFRIRPDTGKEQTLMMLGSRIKLEDLEALLPELPQIQSTSQPRSKAWIATDLTFAMQHPDEFIAERNLGGRNVFFYYLYNRLVEAGFSIAEIKSKVEYTYARLENKKDFPLREALLAARVGR